MPANDAIGLPTPQELQALELLSNGLGRPEIAIKLDVKPATATAYIAQSVTKIGAHNVYEAIMLACSSGLIPLAFERVSVPNLPFRELVNLADGLRTATSMDLPRLQAKAMTVLTALANQNTPSRALCNRANGTDKPH